MSVAGDSSETTNLFYAAQATSNGERQNAKYYVSYHRQSRQTRSLSNQTLPLHYGSTSRAQNTGRQSSRQSPPPHYSATPTSQYTGRQSRRITSAEPMINRLCFFVFSAVSWFVVLVILFYLTGIEKRHSSVPRFPEPMQPDQIEKYRRSGVYWDSPRPLECLDKYHFRQYVAQLQNVSLSKDFDKIKACEALPIKIGDHTFETPDQCKQSGVHMYGYWVVFDLSDCTVEDEMERYRSSGMFWNTPLPTEHCHSYGKREYEAQLFGLPAGFDWYKACNYIPIVFKDQRIEKADSCERREGGIFGKWVASGQLDCKPYWGPLKDVGCQASGKQRYEAPLWNLIEGDDWYAMCYSTSATWNGRFYAHPMTCDNRKGRGGVIGIWESDNCS